MIGYDGISDVVFRTLARVMEQQHQQHAFLSDVDGSGDGAGRMGVGMEQQLVVNKPPASAPGQAHATPSAAARPGPGSGSAPGADGTASADESGAGAGAGASDPERDLNAIEGFAEAVRMGEANLEQMIKAAAAASASAAAGGQGAGSKEKQGLAKEEGGSNSNSHSGSGSSVTLPITTCPVYVRIQPCLAPLPWLSSSSSSKTNMGSGEKGAKEQEEHQRNLYFILLLRDPQNGLAHQTCSQAVPSSWRECESERFAVSWNTKNAFERERAADSTSSSSSFLLNSNWIRAPNANRGGGRAVDVAFEENAWVEQVLVDVLEVALGVIGQVSLRRVSSVSVSSLLSTLICLEADTMLLPFPPSSFPPLPRALRSEWPHSITTMLE